jgi:hypothetical protein
MSRLALLVGINYAGTSGELYGCENDVDDLSAALRARLGFTEVHTLKEEAAPRAAILTALHGMAARTHAEPVQTLWLSYSGHGTSGASADELDGRDELMVPHSGGLIRDDEIHAALAKVHPRTQVVMLWDCCFSGSIGDLRWRYVSGQHYAEENPACGAQGRVLMISGCRDDQYSSDAWDEQDRKFVGAMTKAFLRTLEAYDYDLTCYNLLKHLRIRLQENNFTQVPQLTTSTRLSATAPFCVPGARDPFLTSA